MRLLLDSHTLIWAVDAPSRLSASARIELQNPDNDLLVSAATIWEIAIKVGIGKLSLSSSYREWMTQAIADLDAQILPITIEYAEALSNLTKHHGDPFDRLLVAQAQVSSLPLVSADPVFDQYGISRLW